MGGVVVEGEVGGLVGSAAPEIEVGLVPDLEVPGGDFIETVAGDEVGGEGFDEGVPVGVVLRGGDVGVVPEGVDGFGVGGHLGRHEGDFDEGADADFEEAVVDLVDVAEVVGAGGVDFFGGEAGVFGDGVGIVDADLVVEDAVEADLGEVGGGVDGAEVLAVVVAEGEDGSSGAEGLFPDVGEGGRGGVGVEGDLLGGLGEGGGGEEGGGEDGLEPGHGVSFRGAGVRVASLRREQREADSSTSLGMTTLDGWAVHAKGVRPGLGAPLCSCR